MVVCPDSFKGSLSAEEASSVIAEALRRQYPEVETVILPLADGGEGTGEILARSEYPAKKEIIAFDPLMRAFKTFYLSDKTGRKAFIESAGVIGLPLLKPNERDVMKASSFGVGIVIKRAIEEGCKNITVSLGGSATSDGGMGMLSALGVKFYDKNGDILIGNGENLEVIDEIDITDIDPRVKGARFRILTDVRNPLSGDRGAARIFAPQKGARPEEVEKLEEGLSNFVEKNSRNNPKSRDYARKEGAGAAGGLGFAFLCFLDAEPRRGIDFVLEHTGFKEKIRGADVIITGEGKIDCQSLMGKVVSGVLDSGRQEAIPVIALAGIVENEKALKDAGIKAIFPIADKSLTKEENLQKETACRNLERVVGEELTLWWENNKDC